MNELKLAVRTVYQGYEEAADAIVCDPALAARFAKEVNARPGLTRSYAPREIMRCLLNLRKRGALSLKRTVCD